jgi:hypothetical protein
MCVEVSIMRVCRAIVGITYINEIRINARYGTH